MLGVLCDIQNRDLVGTPESFHFVTIYFLWARPALGSAQNNHGPARTIGHTRGSGFFLNGFDLLNAALKSCCHALVNKRRIVTFYNMRRPPVAFEKVFEFLWRNSRQDGWIGNLVAVQVQDGENRAVAYRV